jgi:hypothetical protein
MFSSRLIRPISGIRTVARFVSLESAPDAAKIMQAQSNEVTKNAAIMNKART